MMKYSCKNKKNAKPSHCYFYWTKMIYSFYLDLPVNKCITYIFVHTILSYFLYFFTTMTIIVLFLFLLISVWFLLVYRIHSIYIIICVALNLLCSIIEQNSTNIANLELPGIFIL